MIIQAAQIWENVFLLIIMALVIELSVSGLFSIRYFEGLINNETAQNLKSILIILIAFGLCTKIPQLRILYKSKLAIPDMIHLILTALILVRIVNLIHNWFQSINLKNEL